MKIKGSGLVEIGKKAARGSRKTTPAVDPTVEKAQAFKRGLQSGGIFGAIKELQKTRTKLMSQEDVAKTGYNATFRPRFLDHNICLYSKYLHHLENFDLKSW